MIWSRVRFEDEGTSLCRCLQEIVKQSSNRNNDGDDDAFALLHWDIKRDTTMGSSMYLKHGAITTSHLDESTGRRHLQKQPAAPQEASDQLLELEEVDPLEDDSILVDSELQHTIGGENSPVVSIQWAFSVVYSDTYQVPVLYFHVQNSHGSPCSRSQVVQLLSPKASSIDDDDNADGEGGLKEVGTTESSWEFASQEQHPHTGFPSYFLHPCQTSARMKLLQEVASVVPLDSASGGGDDDDDSSSNINFLWAWMSMILPAVNHTIPPKLYRLVQEKLQNRKEEYLSF